MGKIRDLMVEIPFRCGMNEDKAKKVSAVFGMLYDYEKEEKGQEFSRNGDSFSDCADRLSVVFDLLDMNARDDVVVAHASQLLMLASTPDPSEQDSIMLEYGENGGSFDDILTVDEAVEIGVRGVWGS